MKYIKLSTREFGHAIVEKGSSLEFWMRSYDHLILGANDVSIDSHFSNCSKKPLICENLEGNAFAVVDANSYELFLDEVKALPDNIEDGKLYSINRGLMGDIQICGSLARKIKNYNWEQFMPNFIEEVAKREMRMTRLRRHAHVDDRLGNPTAYD